MAADHIDIYKKSDHDLLILAVQQGNITATAVENLDVKVDSLTTAVAAQKATCDAHLSGAPTKRPTTIAMTGWAGFLGAALYVTGCFLGWWA